MRLVIFCIRINNKNFSNRCTDYIGSHTCIELIKADYEVDNLCSQPLRHLHVAELKKVGKSVERPIEYYDADVWVTHLF